MNKNVLSLPRFGLHLYAVLTAFSAWVLVWLGGLVTSHEAGMTVPDWPTSFGYNMFLFPISKWTGGIFYEHTHRLMATVVGALTVGLMIALFCLEERPKVRNLGIVLVFMVIAQGILGGLRVTLAQNGLGMLHGCFGQAFFVTLCAVALVTSPWWERVSNLGSEFGPVREGWIKHVTMVTLLVFIQLGLGAAMRASHAGLSIEDFPTAYGAWWPLVSETDLTAINQHRVQIGEVPTSLALIHLQMTHRMVAGLILLAILSSTAMLLRRPRIHGWLKVWNVLWSGLVLLQVFLGAWTIWSGKAADVATAHVAVGAVLLMTGVVQVMMARRLNEVAIASEGDVACKEGCGCQNTKPARESA